MKKLQELEDSTSKIEEILGYSFKDKSLLHLAFIHRSYINENKKTVQEHNERLEFLGDSVLNLIIAEHLYLIHPKDPEGELSSLRASLVEASSCEVFVNRLNLEPFLLLGKGEETNLGKARSSILADLFEAVLGAIFLDGGFEVAKDFTLNSFSEDIKSTLEKPCRNFKAELQDFSQRKYQKAPIYTISGEEGPDHNKEFLVSVFVNDQEIARGVGFSKKEAQQCAAEKALSELNL
ncbi:Ribonuclease 3 [Chlamydiales bacterium SCGC AB-751-O23]|jgi:ribonuclease III|nr:Ribonuclease 3 [Chlamydiales bacterium SCGC AB-751-O23]